MPNYTLKHLFRFLPLFVLVIAGMLMAMASDSAAGSDEVDFLSDEYYEEKPLVDEVGDPLEPFNRAIFSFNDWAYYKVFNPIATGYEYVLPHEMRGTVANFFNNLHEPVRFVNCLLQGRLSDAGQVLVRFALNSTGGILGLADPAEREFNFPRVDASLGETLATWGIGDGCYLVMPLLGPSTLRDFTGAVIDGLSMTPYYIWTDDIYVIGGIYTGKEVNYLSLHLGEYEEMKAISFDPYVAIRNGYFQYRASKRDHSIK